MRSGEYFTCDTPPLLLAVSCLLIRIIAVSLKMLCVTNLISTLLSYLHGDWYAIGVTHVYARWLPISATPLLTDSSYVFLRSLIASGQGVDTILKRELDTDKIICSYEFAWYLLHSKRYWYICELLSINGPWLLGESRESSYFNFVLITHNSV